MKIIYPLAELSVSQLKRALEIRQKIDDLGKELVQIFGLEQTGAGPAPGLRKRKMRRAARAKISMPQIALGDEQKMEPTPEKAPTKKKRKYSPEGKARIIAGIKARWAKYNAEKKQKQITPVPPEKAPAKKKRVISAEGRAGFKAGAKARWAKYNAEKKKKAAA